MRKNGKIERLWGILQSELLDREIFVLAEGLRHIAERRTKAGPRRGTMRVRRPTAMTDRPMPDPRTQARTRTRRRVRTPHRCLGPVSALHAADLRLARDASELRGLRAARWIRESTPGQLDRFGPPSQRRMQDTAISALGLADTGLAWTVGRSGWSGPDSMDDPPATRTPEFRAMLAAAEAGAFDVLLVGYTARYMRDLALALSYRRWFHRQGVVVYICDDRILSSNPADWERFVDKCKAAEINSREQSRNVRAGYAAKRDTHGDPGGHPPFGFRRAGEARVVEIDPERIDTAVRAYALGILTSPLYLGRLRDGTADAAEAEAAGGSERPTLPPDEVRRYLENLPAWWADADPDDRRALATMLFERIRVLGVSVAKLEPTQEARDHGLAEAFGPIEVEMVGARGFEPPTSSSRTMRATKLRHAPTESAR